MQGTFDRHAYLILAHHEPDLLKVLVKQIDDERNDIFIMIDGKSDLKLFEGLETRHSRLFFSKRVRIQWGNRSQIKAEIELLKLAFENGLYARFHLLSGVDMPVKTQNYIHDFCDKEIPNLDLLGFSSDDDVHKSVIGYRTQFYHVFTDIERNQDSFLFTFKKRFKDLSLKIQLKISEYGIFRKYPFEFRMGPNWCSLTRETVSYIIENFDYYLSKFKYTLCCDELFIQTMVWNSERRNYVYDYGGDDYHSCLRKIDWKRGHPYTWKSDDFDELIGSEALFARKFSSVDFDLVSRIESYLENINIK